MKNASHILALVRQRPGFAKLARFECIRRIRELFPPRLQSMIRYGYLHNNILYFVLSHPGAKQEFDNIIASIKAPLRQYTPKECAEIAVHDLRAFVTHSPPVAPETPVAETAPHYAERAKGTFENAARDPQLHRLMERIRTHIRNHSDRTTQDAL